MIKEFIINLLSLFIAITCEALNLVNFKEDRMSVIKFEIYRDEFGIEHCRVKNF